MITFLLPPPPPVLFRCLFGATQSLCFYSRRSEGEGSRPTSLRSASGDGGECQVIFRHCSCLPTSGRSNMAETSASGGTLLSAARSSDVRAEVRERQSGASQAASLIRLQCNWSDEAARVGSVLLNCFAVFLHCSCIHSADKATRLANPCR